MKNSKIKSLKELQKICAKLRKNGKTIGLVTGCFDVLHAGHIELFKLSKKQIDVLVVGLDSDATIKASKGESRPIFPQKVRSFVLHSIEYIDYIFPILPSYSYDSLDADLQHKWIRDTLKPHALVTNAAADRFWKEKKKYAESRKIKFINIRHKRLGASTEIIKQLGL